MTVTPDVLRRIPIFDGLGEAELEEILGCFTAQEIPPGGFLYRQGERAASACFLIDGEMEAVKALPGGGEILLGTMGPGRMIGEMALLTRGERTATVRARSPATVATVSYHFFHAALDQMSGPAFKILRTIVCAMTARLADLQTRILEQWDCESFLTPPPGRPAERAARQPPSFDYRRFLPVLPCFAGFGENEIDEVLANGEVIEVPRGEFLHREGETPDASCLVLRGAVERSVMRDRRYRLSVLGPGSFCGVNACIARRNHSSDARVLSQALLVRFAPAGFAALFQGDATACLKFQYRVCTDQLMQLKAADNLLALLVSQSYVLQEPRGDTV